jgi:uncharacterized protein
MRIEEKTTLKELDKKSAKGSSIKRLVSGLFEKELAIKQTETDTYQTDVDQLKKEIDFYGDTLSREPTLANFKKFRELLGQLVKRVNSEAYRLEKIGGTALNPRYFEVIKVINSEAEQLHDLIVKEQRSNMAITAKIIGIKGLVVDLIT